MELGPPKIVNERLVVRWCGLLEKMRSRLLLVEDDPDVRLSVEHVLLTAGYNVDAVGTMRGAIELLRIGRYNLVLTDERLPDGSGTEIADPATELGIKALIMTGYAFMMSGAAKDRYEVLLKPLRPVEIVTAVERALSIGRLRD